MVGVECFMGSENMQNLQGNNLQEQTLQKIANAVRYLSVCMVEKANSGHPGMPLGAADIATVLFAKFLSFSTKNPKWHNRDRFVLSAGHGSAMLYALLYLFGYDDISMDDLKNFRQLGAKTAGHPEYRYLDAIESTTGPLGQGFATAVGLAIAQAKHETELGGEAINNYTFVLCGDGCLQEGISFEAAELAGHLGLKKLIVLYDSNNISIDGEVGLATSSSTKARFEAHKWNVFECDGHNFAQIEGQIEAAKNATNGKPSIIICTTKIGYKSPKQGSEESHGSPLKAAEIEILAANLGINYGKFEVPADVVAACQQITQQGNEKYSQWVAKFGGNESVNKLFNTKYEITNEELNAIKKTDFEAKTSAATRNLSGKIIEFLQNKYSGLIVGSADLAKSNCVFTKFAKAINAKNQCGNYIHYGIREHAMGAVMNGLYLYGGLLPIGSTFLVFSDFVRPSIRLSAIMHLGVIYVFTHDSIALGEDGPTHQPVEHLSSLRAIPNLNVFRPCDAIETAECYQLALQNQQTPSLFALSRQGIKMVRSELSQQNLSAKGAYIISPSTTPESDKYRIISSGAEIELSCLVAAELNKNGHCASVVSVPCLELFEKQNQQYQDEIFGKNCIRIFIETANLMSYYRYLNAKKDILIDITTFGLSGKDKDLLNHFGYSLEKIIKKIQESLDN